MTETNIDLSSADESSTPPFSARASTQVAGETSQDVQTCLHAAAASRTTADSGDDPANGPAQLAVCAARAKIIEKLPDIISAVIGKANEGSYLHAKFLCEFAGLTADPAQHPPEEDLGPSLADLLLHELELGDQPDC